MSNIVSFDVFTSKHRTRRASPCLQGEASREKPLSLAIMKHLCSLDIRKFTADARLTGLRIAENDLYTMGTWLTLFFGSIQNASLAKRPKISRGRVG